MSFWLFVLMHGKYAAFSRFCEYDLFMSELKYGAGTGGNFLETIARKCCQMPCFWQKSTDVFILNVWLCRSVWMLYFVAITLNIFLKSLMSVARMSVRLSAVTYFALKAVKTWSRGLVILTHFSTMTLKTRWNATYFTFYWSCFCMGWYISY